jgi:histidinol-phosphate/aromatic aminotransferase/cobyric acid decarboxylase-like protein
MLILINTISVAIARSLARAASLLSHLQRTVARARAERARVEAELFHGRYHLSSKNDDDLPLVH